MNGEPQCGCEGDLRKVLPKVDNNIGIKHQAFEAKNRINGIAIQSPTTTN